ncbi:MAG: hypothetical protein ABIQ11_12490 [Saprospiraceae bacterium]
MKRYNLSAEFVRWEANANLDDQVDSFEYVVEVDSEEEAQLRLETLIIERMASKPGWTYRLISSDVSEFSGAEQSSMPLSDLNILAETIRPTEQSNTLEIPTEQSIFSDIPSDHSARPDTPSEQLITPDIIADQSHQANEKIEEVVE